MSHQAAKYDAFLLLSYGGPEGPDDVMPFLQNVVRGKHVSDQRLAEVAKHYELFDGVSPANSHVRALIVALVAEFNSRSIRLPVYWGNRNWHPMLEDTLRDMAEDEVHKVLAFATSAFDSYASYGKYLDDIKQSAGKLGEDSPEIDLLPTFHDRPGFIEAVVAQIEAASAEIPEERHEKTHLIFTAHSIPVAMAEKSDYVAQLEQSCQLVSERLGQEQWDLVYQSRTGPPRQPWLEPDVCDHLRDLKEEDQLSDVVIAPIGFIYENMETVYDLDEQAGVLCEELGINVVRAATVGCHPAFVGMIADMVVEAIGD